MKMEERIAINGPREAVWSVITSIESAAERISGIQKVEVLEKPADGLVGLKWRETRTLFGKTATEVMWITDAVENEYYKTRAESHGCIYLCTLEVAEENGASTLTMSHGGEPQGLVAKVLAVPMGFLFKGAMRKAIRKDLEDIKAAVEGMETAKGGGR